MRLRTATTALLALGATTLATAPAVAQEFSASLNGYRESPPVSTAGTGRFSAAVSEDGQEIDFELSYSGLEGGSVSGAHIHFAGARNNGGVIAFLCGSADTDDCPDEGTVIGTIDAGAVIGPADQGIEPGEIEELIEAMERNSTYVNVHTEEFASGEIRGEVRKVVPEE